MLKVKKIENVEYEVEVDVCDFADIIAERLHHKFGSIIDGTLLTHVGIDNDKGVATLVYSRDEAVTTLDMSR